MTKDIALALVCLVGFVFFLARAESRVPQRYAWLEGATATGTSTWYYTTTQWSYVEPHGIRQRVHNVRNWLRRQ